MKRKTEKSHETLTNITAYPPKTWLIYNHKLTTSKTFSFFPLFRMKIPNSLLTSVVYSLFPHWFFNAEK
ncbi:hypothetical protein Y527_12505 [Listeria monocytogenes]|nr:hypothetical protein EGX77_05460 [Listeria monocytogenes]EAC9528365.1 hypothetical protein [Listeria monocytogenes]EAW7120319.1 hypothetical protein [Listeria monocytogenes]EAW7155761.1 hypothetical protein [Listeria monocytogenes]EBB5821252.1 hypothetical protein [Listeria monocytogenes]